MTNEETTELIEFTKYLLTKQPLLNRMVNNISVVERRDLHLQLDTKDGFHSQLCLNDYSFSKYGQYIKIHLGCMEEAYAAHLDQQDADEHYASEAARLRDSNGP